MLQRSWLS
jgi:hypothetical protein